MNKKQRDEYNKRQQERWKYISTLRNKALTHPNYLNCSIAVDMLMDSSYYESGTIVGISPTRKGFDNLHENYCDLYRGGFGEIKVGNDYVIYGFEFD
jgi:hypothetical protein